MCNEQDERKDVIHTTFAGTPVTIESTVDESGFLEEMVIDSNDPGLNVLLAEMMARRFGGERVKENIREILELGK